MNINTTADAYATARVRLLGKIHQLNELLNAHAKKPVNWGTVGDLNHVAEVLDEVIEFLGGEKMT